MEGVITVIFVPVDTLNMLALQIWATNDGYVIFIFEDGSYSFGQPDIHNCVPNHTGVAASTGGAKRVHVINEKFPILSLNNKPRLVIRKNRACTVELLNVEGASLGAKRGDSNLCKRG